MKCPNCGNENEGVVKFCRHCGKPMCVVAPQSPQPQPPQQPPQPQQLFQSPQASETAEIPLSQPSEMSKELEPTQVSSDNVADKEEDKGQRCCEVMKLITRLKAKWLTEIELSRRHGIVFGVVLAVLLVPGGLGVWQCSRRQEFPAKLLLPGDVILEMLPVKAGTFMMGTEREEWDKLMARSPQKLANYFDERLHRVTLTQDYWLGKFEVTQEQWHAVMGNNPSHFKGKNLPVENVSWLDAQAFCEKLNDLYMEQLPFGYVFSLPTEAQWEYASRAGEQGPFSGGKAEEVCWHSGNSDNRTHPVGKKKANAWGFHDMSGNVFEWCYDGYGFYSDDDTDPTGLDISPARIMRGGGWSWDLPYCRVGFRMKDERDNTYESTLGFRVALVPMP